MKPYAASPTAADAQRPLVALVGRPNVGKSSLYNRLVGGRPALVEDLPGVTRDRRYGVVDWPGARFRVVDTGGLDPSAHGILGAMRAQTLRAIDEADVLALIVDAAEGVTTVDQDVVGLLRRSGKPVVLIATKVDSSHREAMLGEVYALGFPDVFPISASHGRGMGELLDRLVEVLGPGAKVTDTPAESDAESDDQSDDDDENASSDEVAITAAVAPGAAEAPAEEAAQPIRIAFVGKPNVGKSSLVNRLLGEERVLVHDSPGTTRDPIDTPITVGGRDFVLVDTAGLRRRRSVDTQTEAVAAKMSRDQLARCDVAILVIDAGGGATVEDAKIAGLIEDAGRPTVVVLNKRDVVPRAQVDTRVEETRETLPFLSWAPVMLTSALTGAGVATLPEAAARVFASSSKRISTGELNRFLEALTADKPPPAGPNGKHVRLFFATQAQIRPPTFVFAANHPTDVPVSYRRFLSNQLRAAYGFEGAPIRIIMRARKKKKLPPPSSRARD
jgi:GTP-binding protein